MAAKALLEMISGARAVAEVREHGAEALMSRRVFRIDPQDRLVMLARFRVPVGAKQQVGEVDTPDRICRMMSYRLRIDAAGGANSAHIRQQRPEFVKCAEVFRRSPQDLDEGSLGVLPPVERTEQNRTLDFGINGVARGG